MFHEKPDPNVCPHCGASDTIREVAKRYTWQPCSLDYDESGVLIPVEYERFETADETEDETFECASCYAEWPSLAALAHAQRLVKALADHLDHWETRGDRLRTMDDAGRLDTVNAAERIEYTEGMAHGFGRALAIIRGNGEA